MLHDDISLIKQLCDRLCSAHLLVLDKEVSYFLSSVAANETITSIIIDCNKNYSFDNDWQRFRLQGSFSVPSNKRQIIAFVFGLLYKFDINEISSLNTLSSFYSPQNDLQKAYQEFCKELIVPMRDAVISLLKGEPTLDEEMNEEVRTLDKMNEDIFEWLHIAKTRLQSGLRSLDAHGEKELILMIEGLKLLLEHNQTSLLKPYWNGVKNTFLKYRLDYPEMYEIEKLLRLYGLDTEI